MVNKTSSSKQPRAERVKAALPVNVDGHNGMTCDVSTTGIYVELPSEQALGSSVSCLIDLALNGRMVQVKLDAEVVRIEKKSGRLGLALKILNQTVAAQAEAA